jgi:3-phenylpropionate/trans-cinnamate dioxygenase ferredoxin reductase subunit
MSAAAQHVVVGAGQAGARAVEAMRAAGFAGRILLVGEEPHLPYERPPLSKQLLLGGAGPEAGQIHPAAFYAERGIELRLGAGVGAIEPAAGRIRLEDGATVPYDNLLLATGARPRRLALPGGDLPGIHVLRTIEDALAIAAGLRGGARLVVIGGGYIGLEVAAAARQAGAAVTLLEAQPVLLGRALPPEISGEFAALHRAQGVALRLGCGVAGFVGTTRVEAVIAADGERIPADLVVVGIGIVPNLELAVAAGLAVEDGILIDGLGRSSAPGIWAAGDVARGEHALLGRRVRLESWQNAQNQAIAVGRAMCGAAPPAPEIPWFWSDQYALNFQMLGLPQAWDAIVWRRAGEGCATAFLLAGDRLAAVAAFSSPRDIAVGRQLMLRGIPVEAARLADPAVPLKSLLA